MQARDILQPRVVTVPDSATVETAVRLMLQHRVSGLPVVDAKARLVGMVTEGDFLRRAEIGTQKKHSRWVEFALGAGRLADEYRQTHTRHVRDVMTSDIISVDEAAEASDIVRLMEQHRIKRLPVLRGGELVGIISRADLLRAFAHASRPTSSAPQTDVAIRDSIVAEIRKQSWGAGNNANVTVHEGVVELHGAVLDDRERLALRVMAENTPGVKKVEDHLVWVEPVSGLAIVPTASL